MPPDGTVIDRKAVGRADVVPGDGVRLHDLLGPWADELRELGARATAGGVLRSERSFEIGGIAPPLRGPRVADDRRARVPGAARRRHDRRIAEDQVARSERRLQALDGAPGRRRHGHRPGGSATWVSPSVSRVLGYEPADFVERAVPARPPERPPRARARVQEEVLRRPDGTSDAEVRSATPTGRGAGCR